MGVMTTRIARFSLLLCLVSTLALLLPGACTNEVTTTDDDLTPTPSYTEESTPTRTPVEPAISFRPNEVRAGALAQVTMFYEGFDLELIDGVCCATDVRMISADQAADPGSLDLFMFFGVLGGGMETWGVEGRFGQVVGEFDVQSFAANIADISPGAQVASSVLDEPSDYDVYRIQVVEPDSVVVAEPINIGNANFHPFLWLLEDDGLPSTGGLSGLPQQGGGFGDPRLSFFVRDPGTYYLRVQDASYGQGADFSYDLNLEVNALPATVIPEVEPNDVFGDWQDLGALEVGERYQLTGVATTAGHVPGGNFDPNGDLEVFTFTTATDAQVLFILSWDDPIDDFDAVLYDNSSGAELGFGSPDIISFGMATTAFPERTVEALTAADPYALMIANWEGRDGSPWTMEIIVQAAN